MLNFINLAQTLLEFKKLQQWSRSTYTFLSWKLSWR